MRKDKATYVVLNSENYFAQLHAAGQMMHRMIEIAVECGGTLGEGACCDEITMTAEQAAAYKVRLDAEFKTK